MELKRYQEEGVNFMMCRSGTLLADEQGLGKTIQCIEVINRMLPRSVLIICPSAVKYNWLKELDKWLKPKWLSVGVLEGTKGPTKGAQIHIINYDILHKNQYFVMSNRWDLLIVDESQALATLTAIRTKVVMAIKAERKILMSGTPIPNRVVELWPTLRILDPNRWKNYENFVRRYCGGFSKYVGNRRVLEAKGATNQDELAKILRETIMLRREQSEVLELPRLTRIVTSFTPNADEAAIIAEMKMKVMCDFSQVDFDEESIPNMGDISTLRKELAVKKARHFYPTVLKLAKQGPLIVFVYHKEASMYVTDRLSIDGFIVRTINGLANARGKFNVAEDFQKGEVDVIVANIRSASAGLTLTKANQAVFLEEDWSAVKMLQAEKRIHRIGQDREVTIHYLVFNGGLDAFVVQTALKKEARIASVYHNTTETMR